MLVTGALTKSLHELGAEAAELEAAGADVAAAIELGHDPLTQLTIAAQTTERIKLMTAITVAFARSPMTLALQAHDVNSLSRGRLLLGIGSQIKPHIEKRYSMPWSHPAARMREYVLALKAIWACWYEQAPLEFRGEFYQHTLMTPMFTPTDVEHGPPAALVAAVGPLMTRNAAEVADGIILHAFTTPEYIEQTTMPAIQEGLAKGGRARAELTVVGTPFLVSGDTEIAFQQAVASARKQIAFYASTPAYVGVLESVGYGELQPELNRMSKAGRWDDMANAIDETLLHKIALVGEPAELAAQLVARYGDVFDICNASVFTGDAYSAGGYSVPIANAIRAAL